MGLRPCVVLRSRQTPGHLIRNCPYPREFGYGRGVQQQQQPQQFQQPQAGRGRGAPQQRGRGQFPTEPVTSEAHTYSHRRGRGGRFTTVVQFWAAS
ncbi:hypothetical protein Taro_033985 [Colocasia esculenta]|uniref:Uncharacterized protein n=1 Tax=Colocasia esculenta TaxID=4460 RepID=A0A843VVA0_COLES|nr:hypothetical protein [Colocasia esculenta]